MERERESRERWLTLIESYHPARSASLGFDRHFFRRQMEKKETCQAGSITFHKGAAGRVVSRLSRTAKKGRKTGPTKDDPDEIEIFFEDGSFNMDYPPTSPSPPSFSFPPCPSCSFFVFVSRVVPPFRPEKKKKRPVPLFGILSPHPNLPLVCSSRSLFQSTTPVPFPQSSTAVLS